MARTLTENEKPVFLVQNCATHANLFFETARKRCLTAAFTCNTCVRVFCARQQRYILAPIRPAIHYHDTICNNDFQCGDVICHRVRFV